jgi:hypothetical protein
MKPLDEVDLMAVQDGGTAYPGELLQAAIEGAALRTRIIVEMLGPGKVGPWTWIVDSQNGVLVTMPTADLDQLAGKCKDPKNAKQLRAWAAEARALGGVA